MPLDVPESLKVLLERQLVRPALAWTIIRKDKKLFRFTTHDRNLKIGSATFLSAATITVSALERSDSLREGNRTIKGAVDEDNVTIKDLIAKKFDEARVIERLIDWKYPDAGSVVTADYEIRELRFDETTWEATLLDFKTKFYRTIGRSYNRTCDAEFGDPETCGVDVQSLSADTTVLATGLSNRRVVYVDPDPIPTAQRVLNRLSNGRVIFIDAGGNLLGHVATIKRSELLGSTQMKLDLYIDLPADKTFNETVSVRPGCSKTKKNQITNCQFYDNIASYRGFSLTPGFDGVFQTPF